ncbi:MAG TPA: isopentenyl phosphate kinase [Candidatus Bathyarchaeia archaeon]|nr:isopentenyl phosphate kinase [Candidatus Bathyarchaeia archaeon]
MHKLILIKLGGSLITDKSKPFTEKSLVIKRLAGEICQTKQRSKKLLIIGHGGGSFPHVPALKFKTNEGVIGKSSFRGIAEVQDAAARLNRIIVRAFLQKGENAISFSPSSFMIASNGQIEDSFLCPLLRTLDFGMLPIVYGDVGLDLEMGCSILSTETILNHLATRLKDKFKVEKVIYAGITAGVYNRKGQTISAILPGQFSRLKRCFGASAGIDVTGGMLHKVETALKLAKSGIKTLIVNGKVPGNLKRAILGQEVKGTIIN